MKKILFISPTLGNGGAERVMTYLLNYFASIEQFEVFLLLVRNKGNDYLPSLINKVKVVRLGMDDRRIRFCIFPLLKSIREINPNICFVGHVQLNILIAPFIKFLPHKIKFVSRETSVLSVRYGRQSCKRFFYWLFYRNYDKVIAQSDDMREDLIAKWFVSTDKCVKINNPIDIGYVVMNSQKEVPVSFWSRDTFNLLAIGRLDHQKGYDILLSRLAEQEEMNFRLVILGKGSLHEHLQQQIQHLGLSKKVLLGGYSYIPFAYLKQADALILSSRFEGFPNVLLEANALGKPVLANNCMGGINEIIIPGVNGYVTDFLSSKNFTSAFQKLRAEKFDEGTIIKKTKERYSIDYIMPQYENIITSLL